MSITHSERAFVNLSNQHAMCMSHIVICGLSGFTILSIISKKVRLSGGKKTVIEQKNVCFLPLQHLAGTFIIQRRTQRNMITNVYSSSYKIPDILVRY